MTKLTHTLPYAGALPFVFSAICLATGITELPLVGAVERFLLIYGLVIASFMAGVHWGQHLHRDDHWARYLPLFSNLIAIFLWIGYLILSPIATLSLLSGAFALLLYIDYSLAKEGIIPKPYFVTRAVVSLLVISSLTVSGLFI